MNSILQLKGQYQYSKNNSQFGPINIPKGTSVHAAHLIDLKNQLVRIKDFWEDNTLINGALVSVYYHHVVAKSNRIKKMLSKGSQQAEKSIRGSRFHGEMPLQHVFTHFVSIEIIDESINLIDNVSEILNDEYGGTISHEDIDRINKNKHLFNNQNIKKTAFLQTIVDGYYVHKFEVDQDVTDVTEQTIVTLYETDIKTIDLLEKIGIDLLDAEMIDNTTIRLMPKDFDILKNKAPYLIAMSVSDLAKITKEDIFPCEQVVNSIDKPTNEPFIGVIDTLFDETVYFGEWVTYEKMLDDSIEVVAEDFFHGTAVSSIIVDGPVMNPELDDGCGRFRVKHFGVAKHGVFSSFTVLKAIREIVSKNGDIKVWNLSLGSALEINRNFISPEAAELDRIQCDYDIVFVVAGTNKSSSNHKNVKIGAPADSLNSLVVNSVNFDRKPASYHRTGPVLSFFHKPDISYFGGDTSKKLRVCVPTGEFMVSGTSFAAPWIARKMAHLIHHMGFSREVAKALIIDSAAGWDRQDDASHSIGYGVVPIHINNILHSEEDEIRFIMTGITEEYETYAYNIPVPTHMDKFPYYARATLCYFPRCSKNQGVDYTNTEMDVKFGRVKETRGKTEVKSINNNRQGNDGINVIYEETARNHYRKWDNIKHISETIKEKGVPRKSYESGMWGLKINTKERLSTKRDKALPFGVVITLKEMNGVNRIDQFIKLCMIKSWVVTRVDVDNKLDIYNITEEEITLD